MTGNVIELDGQLLKLKRIRINTNVCNHRRFGVWKIARFYRPHSRLFETW